MTSTDIPESALANAAIYYQVVAFNAGRDKVMGRHMAGATFLDGFVRHAETELTPAPCAPRTTPTGFTNKFTPSPPPMAYRSLTRAP